MSDIPINPIGPSMKVSDESYQHFPTASGDISNNRVIRQFTMSTGEVRLYSETGKRIYPDDPRGQQLDKWA